MGLVRRSTLIEVAVVMALVLSACSAVVSNPASNSAGGSTPQGDSPTTQSEAVEIPEDCAPVDGTAWTKDESVTLDLLGEQNGLMIYAAEYPLPGPTEGLWTQWGQGIALGDGRHLSAVGNHLGADGNSWFFLYDDADRSLTRIFDVFSVVPHQQGAWGYGKIHAQLVADECGSIWAATYWGTRRDIAYGNGYEGDRLLEIDPIGQTVSDRGVLAAKRGLPAMAISSDGRTLVAAAVEPESDTALIASYDTRARSVLDPLDDPRQIGFRSLAPSESGAVLYSIGDGSLSAFDPASGTASDAVSGLPGDWLRAASAILEDGSSFGITQNDPELFSLTADGQTTALGDPQGYTTSLARSEDGEELFWLPNAHGKAWEVEIGRASCRERV